MSSNRFNIHKLIRIYRRPDLEKAKFDISMRKKRKRRRRRRRQKASSERFHDSDARTRKCFQSIIV